MVPVDYNSQQTENVGKLVSVVKDLRELALKNSQLKNSILNRVDALIRQLNKDDSEFVDLVAQLNFFISRYEEDDVSVPVETSNIKDQLQDQNRRLKAILQTKKEFNRQANVVNSDFETAIEKLVREIQQRKISQSLNKIDFIEKANSAIAKEKAEEWQLFESIAKNKDLIFKLTGALTELYEHFDENRQNDRTTASLFFDLEYQKVNPTDSILDSRTIGIAFLESRIDTTPFTAYNKKTSKTK